MDFDFYEVNIKKVSLYCNVCKVAVRHDPSLAELGGLKPDSPYNFLNFPMMSFSSQIVHNFFCTKSNMFAIFGIFIFRGTTVTEAQKHI